MGQYLSVLVHVLWVQQFGVFEEVGSEAKLERF